MPISLRDLPLHILGHSTLVDHEDRWTQEFLEFLSQAVGDLGCGERVDDLDRRCKANRVSRHTGGVPEGARQMGLPEPDATEEHHVGPGFDEAEAEEVLDLGSVDLLGPTPLERFQGLEGRKAGGVDASLERRLPSTLAACRARKSLGA